MHGERAAGIYEAGYDVDYDILKSVVLRAVG